ncbi:MAG: phospho-N-acetylmuramoyl-pentapeptide-transferase [Bacteroidales bacterium]|nr:phospho-N-acetylmuramoyl-pentapeptide-transferase [Bacteroidales bacterium]
MFYHLFEYLTQHSALPGARLFGYISFRSAMAFIGALALAMFVGKRVIAMLQRHQIGEEIRELGLAGQAQKAGTPTMGGIIIIASTLLPVLLFANLSNIYLLLMIVSTLMFGMVGFADDYIKVYRGRKEGLRGRYKIFGQVAVGLFVGLTMWLHPDVVVRDTAAQAEIVSATQVQQADSRNRKAAQTTIPFFKNNEFDYSYLNPFRGGRWGEGITWVIFVAMVILVITAVSNSANLTDGLDGLATGISAVNITTLGVFAYLSGNIIYSGYLNIMYIPMSGELVVFASALIGALIGFLWYNSYPAQVFMGDTGSLTIGGIIAVFAILVRKELLLPLLCGVFFVESLSVIVQVSYFKRTKRKYGEGRRVLLMSPLHHHYQKKGLHEVKIVTRFWIVAALLAAITVVTLKLR